MKSRMVQGKVVMVHCALALAGAFLALCFVFATSAQTTLFSDNFQDGDASGWSKSGGTWTVVTDGSLVFRQSGTSADSRARNGSLSWTDYSVQARVKPIAFNGSSRYVAVLARAINVNHFYYLALQNGNQLVLARRDGDTSQNLASKSFTVTTGTFYTLRIDVRGSSLTGFVNGVSQLSATDSTYATGNIGGATFFASGSFDDFVVTSLSAVVNPPAAPNGLAATPGNGQVSLTWNASSGASSYNVKRSTVSGGPYANVGTVTSTNFTNTGLTNGTTFFYVVSAVNSAGESPNSAQVSATPTSGVTIPAAPTGLTATAGDGSVTLSWNASAGATSYNIKRSTTSGGPFNTTIASVSGTSFTDTGRTNGVTLFYVVSAQNSAGQGPNSAQVSATPTAQGSPNFGLFGFAAGVTTGGRGGATVTVTSLSALQSAAASTSPMIIQISGRITGSDIVRVASNKTIVGVGSTGELVNVELGLADSSNIIIRNLKISRVLASNHDGDAIHLQDTHNVWIDHCEMFAESPAVQPDVDLYDGLVDITHDCSFITVSWCFFHDTWKTSLIGSSDSDNFNRRTTFHHNFYQNCNSRVPSYRFGNGHVFNNYYLDILTSGVNSRMGAVLRIEGNVFERADDPITSLDSDTVGFWDVRDNQFLNCTGSQPSSSNGSFNPPYNYPLDSSANVKATVTQFAGVGKINPLQGLP